MPLQPITFNTLDDVTSLIKTLKEKYTKDMQNFDVYLNSELVVSQEGHTYLLSDILSLEDNELMHLKIKFLDKQGKPRSVAEIKNHPALHKNLIYNFPLSTSLVYLAKQAEPVLDWDDENSLMSDSITLEVTLRPCLTFGIGNNDRDALEKYFYEQTKDKPQVIEVPDPNRGGNFKLAQIMDNLALQELIFVEAVANKQVALKKKITKLEDEGIKEYLSVLMEMKKQYLLDLIKRKEQLANKSPQVENHIKEEDKKIEVIVYPELLLLQHELEKLEDELTLQEKKQIADDRQLDKVNKELNTLYNKQKRLSIMQAESNEEIAKYEKKINKSVSVLGYPILIVGVLVFVVAVFMFSNPIGALAGGLLAIAGGVALYRASTKKNALTSNKREVENLASDIESNMQDCIESIKNKIKHQSLLQNALYGIKNKKEEIKAKIETLKLKIERLQQNANKPVEPESVHPNLTSNQYPNPHQIFSQAPLPVARPVQNACPLLENAKKKFKECADKHMPLEAVGNLQLKEKVHGYHADFINCYLGEWTLTDPVSFNQRTIPVYVIEGPDSEDVIQEIVTGNVIDQKARKLNGFGCTPEYYGTWCNGGKPRFIYSREMFENYEKCVRVSDLASSPIWANYKQQNTNAEVQVLNELAKAIKFYQDAFSLESDEKDKTHRALMEQNVIINLNDPQNPKVILDMPTSFATMKIWCEKGTGRPSAANWAASEYLKNEPVTRKVDVFSFGMLMYQIVTGKIPYGDEKHIFKVTAAIIAGEIPKWPVDENAFKDLFDLCVKSNPNHRAGIDDVISLLNAKLSIANQPTASDRIPRP